MRLIKIFNYIQRKRNGFLLEVTELNDRLQEYMPFFI